MRLLKNTRYPNRENSDSTRKNKYNFSFKKKTRLKNSLILLFLTITLFSFHVFSSRWRNDILRSSHLFSLFSHLRRIHESIAFELSIERDRRRTTFFTHLLYVCMKKYDRTFRLKFPIRMLFRTDSISRRIRVDMARTRRTNSKKTR